ncbi:Uncharacterized protein HZ326_7619 [Fusarium oxysporum f. sp. albedinis]|nr:Uncharacterized protein HZ326_7619 [Fusarium oxysporum f. sp. albedinis]
MSHSALERFLAAECVPAISCVTTQGLPNQDFVDHCCGKLCGVLGKLLAACPHLESGKAVAIKPYLRL